MIKRFKKKAFVFSSTWDHSCNRLFNSKHLQYGRLNRHFNCRLCICIHSL